MKFQVLRPMIFCIFLLAWVTGCKPKSSTTADTPTPVAAPTIISGGSIHITGTLTYDFVSAATGKLNYAGTTQKPMRNIFVELLNAADNSVVNSMSTDDFGAYDFAITASASIKLRIYAEMKSPSVIIQDNTNGDAEYALITPAYNIPASTVIDARAVSGWSGSNAAGSYSMTRVAAPFAMLDSVYTITKKIKSVRPAIAFPQLKINWSVNNVATVGNTAIGQIGTSHYNSSSNQLFILGKADVDTDEYDNHVIVHEWGHFLENNISRSDSTGGSHGTGDEKNLSLAFGEAWGNAVSAMTFDPDIIYSDTGGSKQQSGFKINLESSTNTNMGWFSETSIQEILFDIYDSANEAGDNLALGIGPIIDVLSGYQKITPAVTSIYSFIFGLKTADPTLNNNLNTLLATKNIVAITDPYGTGETTDGGWSFNLPIYNLLTLGGATVPIQLYGNFGGSDFYGLYNSVFNNKNLRFTATSASTRLTITSTDSFELDVFRNGASIISEYEERISAGAFGPFVYTFPTTAGQVYSVQVLSAQEVIFSNALISLTVTGAAL